MMDEGPAGGEGRRRGKKSRMRQGRRKRRSGPNRAPHTEQRYLPEPPRDDSSILGSRPLRAQERRAPAELPLDGFALFSAYYLGVTADDRYQKPSLDEIARRFGTNAEGVRKLLVEYRVDEATIRKARFDLEGAQMDIRVAPEGISRLEIAREAYQDFVEARDDGV